MLSSYKVYKNPRGRFISFELKKETNQYITFLIGKNGKHSFITYVDIENEEDFIKKLDLTIADEVEHAKIALYRSNENMAVYVNDEDEDEEDEEDEDDWDKD